MGRILQDGEDPARWGGSCKMGRILQDGEDPKRWGGSYTKEEAKGLFTQSVLNRVLYWGESWQTSAKDIQRIFPEETKGGLFFQQGGQSGMNSLLAPGLQPFSPHFSTQKSGKPEIFSVNCEEKRFRSLTLI